MNLPLTQDQERWLQKAAGSIAIYRNEYEPDPDLPRGKHYMRTAGYAARPGSGPTNETCGSCKHLVRHKMAGTYYKCRLAEKLWTSSRKSDVLVNAPACERWENK